MITSMLPLIVVFCNDDCNGQRHYDRGGDSCNEKGTDRHKRSVGAECTRAVLDGSMDMCSQ